VNINKISIFLITITKWFRIINILQFLMKNLLFLLIPLFISIFLLLWVNLVFISTTF